MIIVIAQFNSLEKWFDGWGFFCLFVLKVSLWKWYLLTLLNRSFKPVATRTSICEIKKRGVILFLQLLQEAVNLPLSDLYVKSSDNLNI